MDFLLEKITDTEEHLFCTAMMKRLDIQRRNEQFCDVILEVGSGDDQAPLKAHRIVLCAASPFFYNALNSDMKEKEKGVIRLKDTSKAVMEEVLDYLYTGHVDITKDNAYDLFTQADYFLMPSLKALSSKFILQTLDVNNCIMSYYFAIKYQGEELEKGARDFILANFVAVARTEDFLNLSIEETEEWISSDKISVKEEEEVFQVIVGWMEKNGNREDLDFSQLLRHVRCIYVSRNFVFNVMLQHPFVNASAACTNFILDAMREVSSGTDECFFLQHPRDSLKTHEHVFVFCGKRTLCYLPDKSHKDKVFYLAAMNSSRDPNKFTVSSLYNKLFVVGGSTSSSKYTSDCYIPSHNLWTSLKPPEISKHYTGTATLQGFLYAIGGEGSNNEPVSTVQKYNPDTNQWQEVSSLSCPRSNVCAVADGNYLYVIGGTGETGEYLKIVERFDPRMNSWEKLPSTHAKRAGASGAVMKQKVFVFGGLKTSSTAHPCEVYDPGTKMWSEIPSNVAPRTYASAANFQGKIYVLGTFQDEQGYESNYMSLRTYDFDKNTWESCLNLKVQEREVFHISTLRISRDVLTKCKTISIIRR